VDGVRPTTAEVRTAAEMPTRMAAATEMCATMPTTVMPTAVMTTAVATTSMTATATFRGGIPDGRQQGHESNDGNPDIEF
jgi:hypothetical protein